MTSRHSLFGGRLKSRISIPLLTLLLFPAGLVAQELLRFENARLNTEEIWVK
jgi:hypothetical protein